MLPVISWSINQSAQCDAFFPSCKCAIPTDVIKSIFINLAPFSCFQLKGANKAWQEFFKIDYISKKMSRYRIPLEIAFKSIFNPKMTEIDCRRISFREFENFFLSLSEYQGPARTYESIERSNITEGNKIKLIESLFFRWASIDYEKTKKIAIDQKSTFGKDVRLRPIIKFLIKEESFNEAMNLAVSIDNCCYGNCKNLELYGIFKAALKKNEFVLANSIINLTNDNYRKEIINKAAFVVFTEAIPIVKQCNFLSMKSEPLITRLLNEKSIEVLHNIEDVLSEISHMNVNIWCVKSLFFKFSLLDYAKTKNAALCIKNLFLKDAALEGMFKFIVKKNPDEAIEIIKVISDKININVKIEKVIEIFLDQKRFDAAKKAVALIDSERIGKKILGKIIVSEAPHDYKSAKLTATALRQGPGDYDDYNDIFLAILRVNILHNLEEAKKYANSFTGEVQKVLLSEILKIQALESEEEAMKVVVYYMSQSERFYWAQAMVDVVKIQMVSDLSKAKETAKKMSNSNFSEMLKHADIARAHIAISEFQNNPLDAKIILDLIKQPHIKFLTSMFLFSELKKNA